MQARLCVFGPSETLCSRSESWSYRTNCSWLGRTPQIFYLVAVCHNSGGFITRPVALDVAIAVASCDVLLALEAPGHTKFPAERLG